MSNTPFIDRKVLLGDISSFVRRNGATFKQLANRMSDLFEMSVYNDVVKYYQRKKCYVEAKKLKRDGTFKYKLTTSGLKENFSYFTVKLPIYTDDKTKENIVEIHHNIKVQSAHDEHIYFTADITVCKTDGAITTKQKNGRNHSYIKNDSIINFFEVKNMNPFPEVMFSFSGLVLEVMPQFIEGKVKVIMGGEHLTPCLVFSGISGDHTSRVSESLENRYKYNIIIGSYTKKGQIYNSNSLYKYSP